MNSTIKKQGCKKWTCLSVNQYLVDNPSGLCQLMKFAKFLNMILIIDVIAIRNINLQY